MIAVTTDSHDAARTCEVRSLVAPRSDLSGDWNRPATIPTIKTSRVPVTPAARTGRGSRAPAPPTVAATPTVTARTTVDEPSPYLSRVSAAGIRPSTGALEQPITARRAPDTLGQAARSTVVASPTDAPASRLASTTVGSASDTAPASWPESPRLTLIRL